MPRFVALLRAINVGGHVVKMDALRGHFTSLGFDDVATFIASGNVLFSASDATAVALERRIARALHDELGYAVETFLRSPAEMASAAWHTPFDDLADSDLLSVGFFARKLTPAERRSVQGLAEATDDFAFNAREMYWRRRARISDSKFSLARLEKLLGVSATFRSITTVRKLAALLSTETGVARRPKKK